MTFTVSSPRQIIPPTRSRHLPDDAGARPETTKPADAGHPNTVLSPQNPHWARSPIDQNCRLIDHPTLKLAIDLEKPSGAALKSP
jgi:hypothetical protein